MGINKRIKRIIAWTMVLTMIPWSSFVYGKNVLAASEYLISMSICDGAGVYYGVKTIAGGAMGLTSQCFVAGTTVKTKDGDKPIEEVEAGDMVWSFNPETGEEGLKEVKETFVNETDEIEHIKLIQADTEEESAASEEEVTIDCTPGHPFYVVNYGFKYSSELKLGDKVLSLDGDIYEVIENTRETLDEPIKVYNFEVADWHTYYVTDVGVLTHNMCAQKSGETIPTHEKTTGEGGSGTNTSWYNQDGSMNYPPNNGAVPGTEVKISLKPGDTLGRYGNIGEKSNFVTQTGADANQLALPPNTDPNIYQEFEVIKEIPYTIQAVVAPWGGSEGGGLQYELPKSILQLIREGYIVPK